MSEEFFAKKFWLALWLACTLGAAFPARAYESDGPAASLPSFDFIWPLREPQILNYYGWRKKKMHEGLDIRAKQGTPIVASAAGVVIYADRKLRGYGRMIALRHNEGWSTVYGHLSAIQTKVGRRVQRGEVIGLSGNSGRSRGPHLHFEIRRGSDPIDPLLFLPAASLVK